MRARSLVCYTSGGLGNRMRVLLGALALAKRQQRKFSYVWDVDTEFSAPVTALWDFPYPTANKLMAKVARKFGVKQYNENLQDLDQIHRERHIQINTVHEMRHPLLAKEWHGELRALNPVAEVKERIMRTWEKGLDKAPYISVMIRAHNASHQKTKMHSSIDWYLKRMEELSLQNSGVTFFLSTDVPEIQYKIERNFDCVIYQEDKGRYNSPMGLRAAVADIYLLASSAFMLKPYWSSFAEMAQALTGPALLNEDSHSMQTFLGSIADIAVPSDPLRPSIRDRQFTA